MPFASSSFYFYFTQSQTSQNSSLCLSILLISQLTFNLSCPVQPLYEDLCCLIVSCYVGVSWYSWDIFSGGETKEWSCGIGEVNGGDLEKWKMETLCLGCVAWEKNLKNGDMVHYFLAIIIISLSFSHNYMNLSHLFKFTEFRKNIFREKWKVWVLPKMVLHQVWVSYNYYGLCSVKLLNLYKDFHRH